MTSKLVVNTIESDTGISSVSFASSISMSSTSKFHFSAAGIDIGADTNINRPEAGVLGFNINGAEKLRITSGGQVRMNTAGAPQADLHVGGTDAVLNTYFQTSRSSGAYHHYALGNNGASLGYFGSAGQISNSGSSTGFAWRSEGHIELCTGGNNERLRITSTGRIGISNSNPQYLIHAKHNGQGNNQRIDLHMTNDTTGHTHADGVQFGYQNTAGAYIWNFEDTDIYFATNNTARLYIRKQTGHLEPHADNAQDLGSSSNRWRNLYTGDLQLSNVTPTPNGGEPVGDGAGNEVDGTEGTWTIQEGLNDLFLINRINGKKYKFNLTEVS